MNNFMIFLIGIYKSEADKMHYILLLNFFIFLSLQRIFKIMKVVNMETQVK